MQEQSAAETRQADLSRESGFQRSRAYGLKRFGLEAKTTVQSHLGQNA